MLETQLQEVPRDVSKKLKRDDFNEKFRFREARQEGLVNCVSCAYMTGVPKGKGKSFCNNDQRVKKIQITKNWYFGDGPESIAHVRVCDAYKNKPLPKGLTPPTLSEGQGMLLGTQWRDPYHADPSCPYVIEEVRIIASGGKAGRCQRPGEISFIDISEMVPGQHVRDMCDMPCCENKLQFQIYDPNGYRTHVGIHPNGRDPIKWVRNGIERHGRKVKMTYEEAEKAFDLTRFNSPEFGEAHQKICVVSVHLDKNVNSLGSRPLTEADNPVALGRNFHVLEIPDENAKSPVDLWMYDERLYDRDAALKIPLLSLERIPEGILPCIDTKGVFRNLMHKRRPEYTLSERFYPMGILKPFEDPKLISKGLTHYLDIRAVAYHGHSHTWGEFGVGFSELESFHEE
jgi:hypothetical protein